MGLLNDKQKKSLVRIVSKDNEKDEEVELGFAAKVKQTTDDRQAVLITSSAVLPQNTDADKVVALQGYLPNSRFFPNSKKNPLKKVTEIMLDETMDVSMARYEGGNTDSNYLYYGFLSEKQKKEAKKLSAYVFDDREIIELQIEEEGESYKLCNKIKEGFDVKRAKGAPVICQLKGENAVVGVLGINDNPDGEPTLYPILLKIEMFEGKKRPSASGRDNVQEPGPSENEEKDESTASSSGAATGDSQTGNQQPVDQGAPGNSDDVVRVGIQTSNKKSDGPAQPTITHNVVHILGNPKVINIGDNNTVTYFKNTNVSNKEEAEDAENNDQNAEHDDVGDRTDNPFVGADVCREVIAMIGGQVDIRAVNCEAFALAVVEFLHLDRTSVDNPPPEMMKNCRKLCVFLKQQERIDIVRELKIKFPNGMTGPLRNEMTVFQELPVKDRKNLTRAISGNRTLCETLITELLLVSTTQIGYYLNKDNTAEIILNEFCQKRRLLVGELYDILVKHDAPALADEYL